jgi:O-antigen/teichoic acid export membrane protein
LSCFASAVVVPVGYFLLPALLSHYGPATVQTARWFLLYVPVSLVAVLMMSAMQGNMRIGVYNTLRSLVQILTVIGMVVAVGAGHATVRGFALATFTANFTTLAVSALLVAKAGWIGRAPALSTARPLLRFGLQSQLGSLASMLNLRLDQMLISALMGASLLGIYVVAVTVAGLASLVPATLVVVAAPRISGAKDPGARLAVWGRILRMSVLLQVLLAAVLWLVSPYLVRWFFGPSFETSTAVARILIVASLPLGANVMLTTGFRACNRPLTPSAGELVSLCVTVIGLALLLPKLGPAGAAWSSLAAYSVTCAFLFGQAYKQLGVTPAFLLAPQRKDWMDAIALLMRRAPQGVGA